MQYTRVIDRAIKRFEQAMSTERWIAAETELVNFFEKRGLIPVLLEEEPKFDIARICRESHVKNPRHTLGKPRGSTTHRRKADLVIWPPHRLTTYGESFTDPVYAPDVLMEFKVDVGDRSKLARLKREYEEDCAKIRLSCAESPGMLGCAVWVDVPHGSVERQFFPIA